ncbi:hypothetical protein Tco_1465536 [Tanacetum coccineum]
MDKRLEEVLMIDELKIVETDKVNHTVETDMMKLVIEIEYFVMTFDEFDKETWSSDGMQPKQADLSCVHALNEPHLHEIHVVPNKHEADQSKLRWLAETLKKGSPFRPDSEPYEPLRHYQHCKKARYEEALRKSNQKHQTFQKSFLAMTLKLDDIIELPKSLSKQTNKQDLECGIVRVKIPRMDAMTLKMDSQYKEMKSHIECNHCRGNHSTADCNDDDTNISRDEEAKFMQTFRRRIPKNLLDRVSQLYLMFSLPERLKADNTDLKSHLPQSLFDVGSGRISIVIVNTLVSLLCSGNITRIMHPSSSG